MESFPSTPPPEDTGDVLKKIGKTVVAGVALLSTVAAEGQSLEQYTEKYESNIAIRENSDYEKQNLKIIHNLTELETLIKHCTKKISKKDEVVYAVISESSALKQANFLPNNVEHAIMEDVEGELVNKEHRTYKVVDRSTGAINALLKEQDFITQYGSKKDAGRIFETYMPVDFYVTIGVSREQGIDSILTATIRLINMDTKETEIHTVQYSLNRRDVDDGYQNLSKLVQLKIKEIIKE